MVGRQTMTGGTRKALRIVITGGGTGGHIYPALAIARGLQETEENVKILYIGTKAGMEAKIVPATGIQFDTITVSGLNRRLSLQNLKTIARLGKGCGEARRILRSFKPDVVVGTGGYVCGPVVLTAALMKIPTLIHEQNAYPGITNRILSRFVDKVCITFSEAGPYFYKKADIIKTGLPIRPDILNVPAGHAYEFFGLRPDKRTILLVGGSRGAKTINQAARLVLEWALDKNDLQLIHVTGRDNYEEYMVELKNARKLVRDTESIKIIPYLDRMDYGLSVADLVVSRAGASFLAEITAVGVPAILVPFPFASENHQEQNARSLEKNGAARVLLEDGSQLGSKLLKEIQSVLEDNSVLETMATNSKKMGKPEALSLITGNVLQLAGW